MHNRQDFIDFIKRQFPNAVLDNWNVSKWDKEQLFYPTPEAEECYTCIEKHGGLIIIKDF